MSIIKKSIVTASLLLSVNSLQAVELETINVTSSTIDDKVEKKESSSVTTLTSSNVQKMNPHSVAELLNTIPGITSTLSGTDQFKVHIRGIDNQRYMGEKPGVAIIIDGVPVQETSGKVNFNLDNIESVKVIKGGASYLYGNDAIAGAIIITTKRPKGDSSSNFETEFGSFGSKKVSIGTNQALENSILQIQGNYRDTDGYWDDAFVTTKSINGKYQYFIDDDSDLAIGLDYTKRTTGDGNSVRGITEAQTNPTSEGYYSYSGYYNSDLKKAYTTYTKFLSDDSDLMLRLHSYEDDKNYKTSRYTEDSYEVWNQTGAKGEFRTKVSDFSLMAGFDLQKNDTDESSYDVVDGDAPRGASDGDLLEQYETEEIVKAIYTEIKHQTTNKLVTTLNLRYDDIKHTYKDKMDSANNVNPDYQTLSYRLGANYALNENLSLYSNFSTGFRTPTVGQTSQNQTSLAADPTLDIPSEIDVETTYNYEVGLRGKSALFNFDASIFQIDRKDYIGSIAGSYITSDDEDESNYDNVGDMRSRGLELSLSSDKSKQISFDFAYTYLDAKFTDYWISQQQTEDTNPSYSVNNAIFTRVDFSGNSVSRSPKHKINLILNLKSSDNKLTVSPELVYNGSYYADEANQFKMGGYTIVNLRTKYKVNDSLELFGQIDNLFNKDYYQFVNVNSSAIATMEDATIRVAAPRAYYAGLRYKF